MAGIRFSDRVRSDRKSQILTGTIEFVSGSKGNITQEGFEGPYAVMSLKNGTTKVRVIGDDSTMLKVDDIVSVEIGNPLNVERGMWNATLEAIPTILERADDATNIPDTNVSVVENESSVDTPDTDETTVTEGIQPAQPTQTDEVDTVLKDVAVLRWERPTTDDKLAEKLDITNDKVAELTADPEYVTHVEQVLLESIDQQKGKIKMKNYIRMAVEYRKVCVRKALARKMHISIEDASGVFERIEAKL